MTDPASASRERMNEKRGAATHGRQSSLRESRGWSGQRCVSGAARLACPVGAPYDVLLAAMPPSLLPLRFRSSAGVSELEFFARVKPCPKMAQLSDEKKAIRDDMAPEDKDSREMSAWGSPINSENSSPRMASAPQDGVSEDTHDEGANTQSRYKSRSAAASKSSTRLDFLDDDDDDPFIERELSASLSQTKEPVVRREEGADQENESVSVPPIQGDIRGLFGSSESENELFQTPSFSAKQTQASPENTPCDRNGDENTSPSSEERSMDMHPSNGFVDDNVASGHAEAGLTGSRSRGTSPSDQAGDEQEHANSQETTKTPSSGPKHPRPDLVKSLSAMKENTLRYKPLAKSFNSRVLVSRKTVSKRCVGGSLVEREQVVFHFSQIEIPKLEDIEIKDEKISEIIGLDKNTPVDKIEDCLGIVPIPIVESDVLIDRLALNQLLMRGGVVDPRCVGELVVECCAKDPLRAELLRAKMGLGFDFARAGHGGKPQINCKQQFDPGYLSYVARLDNPSITKLFIDSQSNFILYYAVFYKLGLVAVGDFAARFYNNLHYLSVLSKINRNEDLSIFEPARQPSESRGWSLKSVLDFGISKILNVENREAGADGGPGEQPYKKLVSTADTEPGLDKDSAPGTEQPVLGDGTPRFGGGVEAGGRYPPTLSRPKPMCVPSHGVAAGGSAVSLSSEAVKTDCFSGKLNVSRAAGVDIESLFDDDDEIDIFDDRSDIVAQINRLSIKNPPDREQAANAGPGAQEVEKEVLEGADAPAPGDSGAERLPIYQNDKSASSSSSLEKNETQGIYKKKFSKSFADIFSLGNQGEDSANLDVSAYVDDINENDKPMLVRSFEEESRSSIFNVFGIFKKKDRAAARESAGPQKPRPLRSTMKIPEKERTVVKSVYANKKSHSLEIPGAAGGSVRKQAIHPDRSLAAASRDLGEDTAERSEE